MKLLEIHPGSSVTWIVFSATEERAAEARAGAQRITQCAARTDTRVLSFRDGYFPHEGPAIKDAFESVKASVRPDLILTHYRDDRHQDHRTISDLTWNTYRNHLIWEYEVPKFDGDFGTPNLFVALEDRTASAKCEIIMETFVSQKQKHWLDEELLRSVLRIRGMESGGSTRYAEAFYTRKITV